MAVSAEGARTCAVGSGSRLSTARGPSDGLPKRTTLPGPTSRWCTGRPSVKVPLVLSLSSSTQWPLPTCRTAWCQETRGSSSTTSLTGSRPTW